MLISIDYTIATLDVDTLSDVLEGRKVLIAGSLFSEALINFRSFVDKELRDDWLISLRLDYDYHVKIVNKKHDQQKQIINLINASTEYGIYIKRKRLFEKGILMLYYLFQKFAPPHLLQIANQLLTKERVQITFNELKSLFMLLLI